MKGFNVYIDFGGKTLKIFKSGEGLILKEPTLISVKKQNGKYQIINCGYKAKITDSENIVSLPLINQGEIVDVSLAGEYLKRMLLSIFKPAQIANLHAKMLVTSSLPMKEQKKYFDAIKLSGIKNIELIDSAEIVRLSLGNQFTKQNILIIDFGASKVCADIFCQGKKACGAMIGIGENTIEQAIMTTFKEQGIIISQDQAEILSKQTASLIEKDNKKQEIEGISFVTGETETKFITSKEIYPIVFNFFKEISMMIKGCLRDFAVKFNDQPVDSIVVIGGLSQITGLEDYLKKQLKIDNVIIDDNFENALILRISQLYS